MVAMTAAGVILCNTARAREAIVADSLLLVVIALAFGLDQRLHSSERI
jgi:hypothetical protein